MINPFNYPESFDIAAEIQIFLDHHETPVLKVPFWGDGVDLKQRVLRVANQMSSAYAYASDFSVTIRVIINHRAVNF